MRYTIKTPPKGIKFLTTVLIFYGIMTLMDSAGSKDLDVLLAGIPHAAAFLIKTFFISYGFISILCGTRILRFENWARVTALFFVFLSLVSGLFVSPVVLKNLKVLYSLQPELQKVPLESFINGYVFFTAIFTVFELYFIYYFTKPVVSKYFSN